MDNVNVLNVELVQKRMQLFLDVLSVNLDSSLMVQELVNDVQLAM